MRKVVSGDVKDVTFRITWHGPSAMKDPAHTHAADLFSGLVNQPTSRAQMRLVDGGVVDYFGLGYATYRQTGPITLVVRTSEDRAAAATRMIGEEIAALARGDFFNEDDLTSAKKRERVGAHYLVESASSAAGMLSTSWSAAGPEYYAGYEAALDAQTAEQVKGFSQAYLAGKPYSVVVMIPRFAPPALRSSIEQGIVRWGAAR
jgi:zinc protease